jgi:rhomboid family GlyGly-CTERM serine protease
MLNLPLKPAQFSGPLTLLMLIVLAHSLSPVSYELFAYHRDGVSEYQWWRLLSAHLLHTNLNHLLLNSAGIILLWAVFGEYYRLVHYAGIALGCALVISAGLYLLVPALQWYVGLSGVLHGLFAWGALCDIRTGRRTGWLLLLGLAVKVGYEAAFGGDKSVSQLIEARVATEAHLLGAISGLLFSLPTLIFSKKSVTT